MGTTPALSRTRIIEIASWLLHTQLIVTSEESLYSRHAWYQKSNRHLLIWLGGQVFGRDLTFLELSLNTPLHQKTLSVKMHSRISTWERKGIIQKRWHVWARRGEGSKLRSTVSPGCLNYGGLLRFSSLKLEKMTPKHERVPVFLIPNSRTVRRTFLCH